jgi:nucleotide-binding universal stress UspA family protein
MFETVVIATDGSASAERAIDVAVALAETFDATVHALYVVDAGDVDGAPAAVRDEYRAALEDDGADAVAAVEAGTDRDVVVAVREGDPELAICRYADAVDADVVATGTRGRHGEHSFLLGSVAEAVLRRCPVPVLTVRQLADEAEATETAG